MKFLSKDLAKRVISKSENIQISNEQLQILDADLNHPLVINAIAGSGKTTTMMIKIMFLILTGELHPRSIMGITFSKKSQMDMKNKYKTMLEKVLENYNIKNNIALYEMLKKYTPSFATFHALFFRCIQVSEFHNNLKVLSNNNSLNNKIYNQIDNKSEGTSKAELIKEIFKLKNKLINLNYSTNGLDFIKDGNYINVKNEEELIYIINKIQKGTSKINLNDTEIKNYYKAMNIYNDYKQNNRLIDFSDMKSLVYKDTNIIERLDFYKRLMANCKYIVLDEFQDIDMIQWKIITKIISDNAKKSLTVIGDDDQSIYRFRGSTPKYILHFNDYLHSIIDVKANTKMLTTNYRTGGKILKTSIPMIENNKQRINKKIKAFATNNNKGSVYVSRNLNMYISKIISDLNNNVKKNSISVITRYNDSQMLLCDKLADNQVYIQPKSKGLILQNNKYFECLVNSIKAFYLKDIKSFFKIANEIGFYKYNNHIQKLVEKKGKKINNFDNYFSSSLSLLKNNIQSKDNTQIKKTDNIVKNSLYKINIITEKMNESNDNSEFKTLLKELVDEIKNPTKNYYDYMIRNNFISFQMIDMINKYLEKYVFDLWKSTRDIEQFLIQNDKKKTILNSKELINNKNSHKDINEKINLMSIHQSKGLEFENVYLFDLNDKEIADELLLLERYFNSEMRIEEFGLIINKMDKDQIKAIEKIFLDNKTRFNGYYQLIYDMKKFENLYVSYETKFDETFNRFVKKKHFSVLKEMVNKYISTKSQERDAQKYNYDIYLMFIEIIDTIKQIEEERRLLYVAITRAKSNLFLDLPLKANPLLRELDLRGVKELSNTSLNKDGAKYVKDWKHQNKDYIKKNKSSVKIYDSKIKKFL